MLLLAEIYTAVGRGSADAAVELLTPRSRCRPGSQHQGSTDPRFAPLLGNSRFEHLVAGKKASPALACASRGWSEDGLSRSGMGIHHLPTAIPFLDPS
jgi:hypothetical protein